MAPIRSPRLVCALFLGLALGACRGVPHEGTIIGAEADSTCADCHLGGYNAAAFDHDSVNYGLGCEECHLETTWTPQNDVEHDRFFALIGAHDSRPCADCHTEGRADPQPTDCVGCHRGDTIGIDPDHSALGDDCSGCHTSDVWRPAAFDHEVVFPLRGAHTRIECGSCHIDDVFQGTPRDCVGCHADDRDAVVDPDHGGYPDNCRVCHTEQQWRPADFSGHDLYYPLIGQHQEADCSSCHIDDVYQGTPRDCIECHVDDRDRAQPPHIEFPANCAECHTPVAWRPAQFDHDQFWPLTGEHTEADCNECHVDGVFDGTPTDCVGCHASDRVRAEPDHTGIDATCQDCHTTTGWTPTTFEHDQHWPLTGQHLQIDCASCHADGVYDGTPEDCVGCHADDRDGVVDPDHTGLPQTCDSCHTTTGWTPAGLDHDQFWPLTGQHVDAECGSCHINDVYRGTNRDCVGCHVDDRDRAQPPHDGFPAACNDCHTTEGWTPAGFEHDAFWPLEGQHARAQCGDCHINDVYAGTPRDCVGCHADDRIRAQPPHDGFPAACNECHTVQAWSPAEFEHDVFFRLEGAHVRVECGDCHINDVYAGTPRTCVGCHADDRDGALPLHDTFSNTCTECHTQNDFSPAFHRHRQFVVPHEGVSRCLDCHTDPRIYANVGCTSCHEHSRGNTDGEHRGVAGYRYVDAACLDCHPDGGD